MREREIQTGKTSLGNTERNDCVVRAIANAWDLPYGVVYRFCSAMGRRQNCGIRFKSRLAPCLNIIEIVSEKQPLRKVLDSLSSEGTYLILTYQHMFCVKNGVIYDTSKSVLKQRYAQKVYRVKVL